jgi:hypothetical protein
MKPADDQTVASQVRRAGYCTRPIRLHGRIDAVDVRTGEMYAVVDSADEPGGALLVACRNRRATACPACADVYRGDAWQLIAAGLRGGKGVSADVASRPRVFVTLTAPGFGSVHSRRMQSGGVRRCRPRRSGVCSHGRLKACRTRHDTADPLLGQPLCSDCFRYDEAVLWNANAGALWNRTVIAIRRGLAQRAGVAVRQLSSVARLAFIKVIEYQARGVVHLHAVVRIDGPDVETPPPASLNEDTLVAVLCDAVAAAQVPCVLPDNRPWTVHWGEQTDIRPIDDASRPGAVAAYIAKYATKSTDSVGALDRRIRRVGQIERLAVNEHLRQLVRVCWQLGGDDRYITLRLRAWAHTLGYRGHWTTKSRQYSTTFTALRTSRADHAAGPTPRVAEVRVADWRYAGRGYGMQGA